MRVEKVTIKFLPVQVIIETEKEAKMLIAALAYTANDEHDDKYANEMHQMAMQIGEGCGL